MKRKKLIYIALTLVFMFTLVFAGNVQAATVNDTDLRQLFDRLDNQSKWDGYKTMVDQSAIAWGESMVMRSYLLMYQATRDKHYLDLFTGHADSLLGRRDSVRGVKDYRGLSLPAWRSGSYTDNYYIYAVQTGLIVEPMAQFAALVKKDPALTEYGDRANRYLQAAKDAIAVHDMRDKPQYLDVNSKWYEDATTMYLDRPVNMNLAQGSAMLAIYEASGDRTYLDKATKIANYLKKYLIVDNNNNSYYWKYYPTNSKYNSTIEDISHSTWCVEFINLAYRNGIFSDADMRKFANTASKVLVKSDGSIARYLNGNGTATIPGQIAHWLWFEPWAPSLVDVAYNLFKNKTSVTPNELAGVALLNYAYARSNQSEPPQGQQPGSGAEPNPAPEPEPAPAPDPEPAGNLIVNGDFNNGTTGWVNKDNTAVVKTESSGNKYVANAYNFKLYQELKLQPGTYKLNVKTRKGTAAQGVRIPVQVINRDGSSSFINNFKYRHSGSGWESMPEMTIQVPSTAAAVRIYLSVDGGTGTHDFDEITLVSAGGTPEPAPQPDTKAPVVTITAPAAGAVLKGTVVLEGTASDNKGVSRLTFACAAGAQGPWTTIGEAVLSGGTAGSGTWRLSWDVTGLADGTYYLRAGATDAAGNGAFSEPVTVQIKNNENLIVNGDFNNGTTGWVNKDNTAVVKTESSGNKYVANAYNFKLYQELKLQPGTYKLNVKTRKGTAAQGVRIPVQVINRDGSSSFINNFKYRHSGRGWESMPEMTIQVPSTAVAVRIYLSVDGGAGIHYFDDITLLPAS